jgi:hypothetical protein
MPNQLTAFFVDNGPRFPIWYRFPTIVFWVGPSVIGLPLLFRVRVGNGRAVADLRATARAGGGCSLSVKLPRAGRPRPRAAR